MAVMSAVVYYIIPGLLGRAYDLKNDTVGPDLFLHTDTAHARTIERYMTISEYRVVSESSEATDFLDVSGKLALKLKTGAANVEGTGSYLKESTHFNNRVDLLVKVHYETVTETIPTSIKPMQNWQDRLKGTTNTHYIRSIKYGGDLVASVRFTTSNSADKEIIKAEVQGELNAKSGSFGAGLKGNLEKIKEKIGDSAFMDINYYATVPLENIPRTIEGLSELVDKFPEQTKKVNNGKGVPLSMEVFSLEGLNKNLTTYFQTLATADQMVILNEQLTDIRNAKQYLADWLKTIPPALKEEQMKKLGEFNSHLEKLDRIFCETIAKLDLSANATGDQFKAAFKAYQGDKEEAFPNMYVKELNKLKKEALDNSPSFETDFGGAHYNYWGSDTCPTGAKLLFEGVMSSTDRSSIGSSEFTCMPSKRQYIPNIPNNEEKDIEELPQVQPVAFVSRKTSSDKKKKIVKCASCRVPGKTSSTVLTGTTDCPGNWTAQYKGVLVSTDFKQARGELVCLDVSKSFSDAPSNLSDLTELTEVSPKCGNFPCSNGINEKTAVPCVVCTITKKADKLSDFLKL